MISLGVSEILWVRLQPYIVLTFNIFVSLKANPQVPNYTPLTDLRPTYKDPTAKGAVDVNQSTAHFSLSRYLLISG